MIYILLWLLINTWIGVLIMTKDADISDLEDVEILLLISILSYPILMFVYRTIKRIRKKRRRRR